MDNITHTLTGLALSHAGLNRKTRFASLALVLGTNLPDTDVVTRLAGSATYLKYHRGITHSISGATLLAAMLAGLIYSLGRKLTPSKTVPPLDGRWLFVVCWIATASHVVLDFINPYGIRPFLPFSGRWVAGDLVFIFDPLLLALMLAGLGLPALFRMVSEEVGAPKKASRGGAIFALSALVALSGVRDLAHRRVLSLLDSHTYNQENPRRLAALPSPANPFEWIGVVETDSAFAVLAVNARDSDVDPENAHLYHKPEPSKALDQAMKTRTAMIFSGFARFLWPQVEQTEDGTTVVLQDIRFVSPRSRRRGFVVEIDLDRNLQVRSEEFSFTGETSRRASR